MGTITTVADDVCVAAIMSVEGIIKVSVYDISYFAQAKLHVHTKRITLVFSSLLVNRNY
jgi:hypothetical protein